MASGKCTYLVQVLLDYALGTVAWTPPSTIYVALSTSAFDATTTGASLPAKEVATMLGYARVALPNTTSTWTATTLDGTKKNRARIGFPNASAAWGDIRSFYLLDGASMTSADHCLYGGDLTADANITTGPGPAFAVGDLSLKES